MLLDQGYVMHSHAAEFVHAIWNSVASANHLLQDVNMCNIFTSQSMGEIIIMDINCRANDRSGAVNKLNYNIKASQEASCMSLAYRPPVN